MKKTLSISAIAVTILLSACRKDLNQVPISTGTTATFYKTQSDFLNATNAIYADLRTYPDRIAFLSEVRSDNIYGVSVSGRDWDPINDFSPSVGSEAYVEECWSTDFNGVFRANTLLNEISINGANAGPAAFVTRITAEARYLRAFYYFDMLRYYGGLPIIDHPLTVAEANTIARSSVSDVYKFIIADLQFAIANLPTTYTGVDVGRASKYAAEATLAQVYMARSGPTYGVAGPGLASNEWNLAIPLIQDIINSGLFVFNPNYANIFSYSNQSPTTSGNREAVFDVMYVGGISGTVSTYGADYVWQLTPNGYFLSLKDTHSNGSLEIIPTSNNLVTDYTAGDVRKTATIYTAGYTANGSTETRPFFIKWLPQTITGTVDGTKIPTTSRFDWPENFIAIRYTDILMMKAECILNGSGGGAQTDVDAIVNQVRTRAGLTPITGVTLAQLFDERRKEFADEGSRWFDLQRSGNLITIMNNWIQVEDTGHHINTVTANGILYPVPTSQINAAPGLYTQNPGY